MLEYVPLIPQNLAIVAMVVSGALAAVASQFGYNAAKSAERPCYIGGAPIEEDNEDATIRADGQRERAGRRAALCQTATTLFTLVTVFLGPSASLTTPLTNVIAIAVVLIASILLGVQLIRWLRENRRLIAATEYQAFYLPRKFLGCEEIKRQFAEQNPKLAVWL